MHQLYDRIGLNYAALRRADPRLATTITAALAESRSVANIGAGAGSYEPSDRLVIAVEPSMIMINQRPAGSPAAVCASATQLPLRDRSFDAALAVLTLHHWPDQSAGLREMARVARERVVLLTFDTKVPKAVDFWLLDYFPQIEEADLPLFPPFDFHEEILGPLSAQVVPIPHDCTDGFLAAYWRRPHAYLDSRVRAGISAFARIDADDVEKGVRRLAADLSSGVWERRWGHLLSRESLDFGYRLLVAADLRRVR